MVQSWRVKLELKGPENAPYEPGRDFNVMLAFDDDVTASRADKFLGLLERHLKDEPGRLLHQWWNIDILAFTSMGELAALEAAAADMIILAIRDADELPGVVAVWIKQFLGRRKGRPGALLAMLESDPGKLEVSQGVFSHSRKRRHWARWTSLPRGSGWAGTGGGTMAGRRAWKRRGTRA